MRTKFLIICISFLILSLVLFFGFTGNYKNEIISYDRDFSNSGAKEIVFDDEVNKLPDEYNNNDVVGFINFPSLGIRDVIMQSSDNDYYLNHTPDGRENYSGSIFLDYRLDIDSSKKLIVYGHSSRNEKLPFNFLQNYYSDQDYFLNNRIIEITTDIGKKNYEIFSVYVETSDFSYMETDFVNDDEYLSHIEGFKNKSIYDSDVVLSKDDEVLVLQTCSTHDDYKDYENKYLLIVARRV